MEKDQTPAGELTSKSYPKFTTQEYKRQLLLALSTYKVALFTEEVLSPNSLLIRHDVDVSLNRALSIARVENEIGVQSTFFIDPLSAYYSIFEPSQKSIIREISELGHQIGLHFDSSHEVIQCERDLEQSLLFQSTVLSKVSSQPVAFSFHNPSSTDLAFVGSRYAGLVNTYSDRLFRDISYVSDSNGFWRFRSMEEALLDNKSKRPLQVLIHPEWWQDEQMEPRDRILRSIQGRANNAINAYDTAMARSGRGS